MQVRVIIPLMHIGPFLAIIFAVMDDSSYRRNFELDQKNETITIAGKSILK
jgi:hypothetical protein